MNKTLLATLAALPFVLAVPAHAEKTVGNVVDDSTINAEIKAALFDDKNTHATQINVETYKGVVQLSGFVATQAEKDEAGRIAQRVSGVKEVRNSIELHPSTSFGTKVDDTWLTSKVKAALIDAADVKSHQINVESKGGVVQLSGFVTSEGMKERAGKVASTVEGVRRVDNVLQVKPQ